MASTAKCRFCGAVVSSDQKHCPECGAENDHYVEDKPERIIHPKSIEELKEYCAERGMPLLRMRFFIGEDYKSPRAFGIFRDGDMFTVYKNKADGSRAVRYHGPDEQYAVNEIFTKLLDECHMRGIYPDGKPENGKPKKRIGRKKPSKLIILLVVLTVGILFGWIKDTIHTNLSRTPLKAGYYLLDNTYYYLTEEKTYDSSTSYWYEYIDNVWQRTRKPDSMQKTHRSYQGESVSPEWNIRAIPLNLNEKAEKGYYLYDNTLYWTDGDNRWCLYDSLLKKWESDRGFKYDGMLLYFSDYYQGSAFQEIWEGFDLSSSPGYYEINGEIWYIGPVWEDEPGGFYEADGEKFYYGYAWHLYDDGKWKKASCPVKKPSPFFQSDTPQEEWKVRTLPAASPVNGYYRYDGTAYCVRKEKNRFGESPSLAVFQTDKQQWDDCLFMRFPFYDAEGCFLFPEDHYGGTSFPADWEGRDYIFYKGYYRWQGTTYYFCDVNYQECLYRYDSGWKRSVYPVGNLRDYYEGEVFQEEWGGEAFRLPEEKQAESGYYRYDGELYYNEVTEKTVSCWYKCVKDKTWKKDTFPQFDKDDYLVYPEKYYLGAEYDDQWGGCAYNKGIGYYNNGRDIYYNDGSEWYIYDHFYNIFSFRDTSSWKSVVHVPDNISEYYSGTDMPDSGTSYDNWRIEEAREQREKEQEKDSYNWSSNDYDSWDSSDTDWDSDW